MHSLSESGADSATKFSQLGSEHIKKLVIASFPGSSPAFCHICFCTVCDQKLTRSLGMWVTCSWLLGIASAC